MPEIVVLLNHHEGKGDQDKREKSERPRGASAIPGAARAVWTLAKHSQMPEHVILACGKSKGEKFADVVLRYDKAARWFIPTDAQTPSPPLTNYSQILAAIPLGMEKTTAEIAALFAGKLSRRTVERCLQMGTDSGDLIQPGMGAYLRPKKPIPPHPLEMAELAETETIEPVEIMGEGDIIEKVAVAESYPTIFVDSAKSANSAVADLAGMADGTQRPPGRLVWDDQDH